MKRVRSHSPQFPKLLIKFAWLGESFFSRGEMEEEKKKRRWGRRRCFLRNDKFLEFFYCHASVLLTLPVAKRPLGDPPGRGKERKKGKISG